MTQWIMHIDMDAFFASVEELDAPELRGLPVIVGGGSGDGEDIRGERGVVCAASYAARKFGVHSAMPLWQARRLCPKGIFVPTRKWRYAEKSAEVMAVFGDFSPVVEQASVDEAYVDATGLERIFGPVEEMAMELKRAVKARTGLTCSVGLAPVKFVAKIASDMRKPDGLFMVREEELGDFLASLPVGKIPGVGKKMLAALDLLGVRKVGDVLRQSQGFWEQRFGKGGLALYERAQGIDTRKVEPFTPPKSESAENTFSQNTKDMKVLRRWLLSQSERVGASLRRHGLVGRTVTLKVKFADFRQVTRSHSMRTHSNTTQVIFDEAMHLLEALALRDAVRLIGVGVSGLETSEKIRHDADGQCVEARPMQTVQQAQATQLLLPLGPELTPEPKAKHRPELKSEHESEHRPELKSEQKAEHRPELKSEQKAEHRPELKSELKSKLKSELKPKLKTDHRPNQRLRQGAKHGPEYGEPHGTQDTSPSAQPRAHADAKRTIKLEATLDALRERYGMKAVQRGDLLGFDVD
ncbi:MAG: DNA polymerase IV [Pseudomonadota bacterium]